MSRLILAKTMLLLALATNANAGEVIAKFSGSRSTQTAVFETDGPWLLQWRVNSEYRGQATFELNLVNADTGFFDSRILRMRRTGNGLKLFTETGKFRFDISSNFSDWYLTVEQLTEEEAEQYTPVE